MGHLGPPSDQDFFSSWRTIQAIAPKEPTKAISNAIVMGGADGRPDYVGLVFVYVSLKRAERFHHQLNGAAFEGTAELHGHELYDLGPFPMAIRNEEAKMPVSGELYRLNAQQLQDLDRFEGAPRLYKRALHVLADGREAWVYLGSRKQVRYVQAIPSGCWRGSNRHQTAARQGQDNGQT